MFLKSLTLKGFKSFADRAHMSFEEGLTVIVGPNGSGKSNISDAILWVLGEQSAKQLRGQAMEDVIFSGSSARKPVGVAEVTLVLDNADRTLPVDFHEVAITRRMYRSGESEYLINASPCRLMDIQDILHDSGLGKDTHSIISQGKLDAILQSRPEERRALIEEAAGISKHKRRKERAQKKISSMDAHLTRARDINRELTRQLRPLERQVDRARKYQDLTKRAHELTQILAVDELRRLQSHWKKLEQQGTEADAALELATYRHAEKERELEKLQVMLEEKGLFVGDLGEQRRHMQDVVGRIGSDMRLLEEKGRNMVRQLSEMRSTLSGSEHQYRRVQEELQAAQKELDEVRGARQAAEAAVQDAGPAARELHNKRTSLEQGIADMQREVRGLEREIDDASLQLARLRETLSNAELEDSMFASRIEQIEEQSEQVHAALSARRDYVVELEAKLTDAKTADVEAKAAYQTAQAALVARRAAERAAADKLSELELELNNLRRLDDQHLQGSEMLDTISSQHPDYVSARFADVFEAPADIEKLVEKILGSDMNARVVSDANTFSVLVPELEAQELSGAATLVTAQTNHDDASAPFGTRLIDMLSITPGYEGALRNMLGHYYVVDSVNQVLGSSSPAGVMYVTRAGTCISHTQVLRLGAQASVHEGTLERKRRIRELADVHPDVSVLHEQAQKQVLDAERALEDASQAKDDARQSIAQLDGELASARSEIGRMEHELSRAQAEMHTLRERRHQAAEKVQAAQPKLDELSTKREAAREHVAELRAASQNAADELEQLRIQDSEATEQLAEAKIRLASATERERNLAKQVPELEHRLERLNHKIHATQQSARSLEVLRLRIDPLHSRYDALLERAHDWAARLRDQASMAEAGTSSLRETIEHAKAEVATAKTAVDDARASLNELQVARGKLEVQVENALASVTAEGGVLEEALMLPAPDDPAACRRELEDIARQINNLGPVNQVAFQEYEELKERSTYVEAQLQDLERARNSLTKIIHAIDRKMKNQFLLTFAEVNKNFCEVFSMLFPGGQARLEMTDPEHPATTGIEVVAQPRGKRIAKMMLMSGGEKSLTALALLFAVYRTRTVPFYVLDEVEAALDDANLSKLIGALDTLRSSTQLLVISHQRRTMEDADVLYGVSMQADGVSRVVSQRLDRSSGKVVNV
ncbi:chromosome segregation protein SMC [Collinsella sp. zg1085]|uniref:chromosome segregation protein SMC n=1 Tax=Collinsella sp. zg1085 TaxID=2844380 RepID=UPI001C0BF0B6|nr:chromosome segregation protein SMC [Collinsella sp. zg1085]QWT17119.1 chromosome segregation protein SMC [Collinsella sp. zg1085]